MRRSHLVGSPVRWVLVTLVLLNVTARVGMDRADAAGDEPQVSELAPSAPQTDHAGELTKARECGWLQVHNGDVLGASTTLRQALLATENVTAPDAALLEEADQCLQVLAFFSAALLSDDNLEAFCEAQSSQTPMGSMIRVRVHRLYRDSYSAGRPYIAMDDAAIRDACRLARDSESALARFVALAMLASPRWDVLNQEDVQGIVVSLNELAATFPDNRITRNVLHQLIRSCGGKTFEHPEAVRTLLEQIPWSAEVQSIIADDPVVAEVQGILDECDSYKSLSEAAARSAVVDSLLTAVSNNPDSATRIWCVRSLASTNSLNDADESPLTMSIRQGLEEVASARTSIEPALEPERIRAAYTLFANDVDSGALDEAEPNLPILRLSLERAYTPDLNYFEAIPRKIMYYALARVKEGSYGTAQDELVRLQALYPNSYLAQECERHLNHLNRVQSVQP